jgi:hypothetical protein
MLNTDGKMVEMSFEEVRLRSARIHVDFRRMPFFPSEPLFRV